MQSNHVAIWMDHREARVFHITRERNEEETLKAHRPVHHQHQRGPEGGVAHPEDDRRFFHEIARTVDAATDILILGPSTAKLQFIRYLHLHEPKMEPKIVGVETVDHPTDRQIIAYAHTYFKKTDQMR